MSPNRKILSIEITQMIDTMLLKGVQKVQFFAKDWRIF